MVSTHKIWNQQSHDKIESERGSNRGFQKWKASTEPIVHAEGEGIQNDMCNKNLKRIKGRDWIA